MEDQLVSAIVTTHNRAPDIVLRAVNSVLNQSYKNIELIVVDDSDCDYPRREEVEKAIIAVSHKTKYIKHKECLGACAARNTGLSVSNGYYAAFLDDDDEWTLNKIEEQKKGFTDPDIALVYCGYRVINEIRNKEFERKGYFQKGVVFNSLLKKNFIGGTSVPMIKKECIEEVGGFDTEMQSAQDIDLWLRITRKYQINYIEMPLVNHYNHNGKRITADIDKKIKGLERLNTKYAEYIKQDKSVWYSRNIVLIPYYIRKGWKKKAWSLWLRCFRVCPWNISENLRKFFYLVFGVEQCSRLHHY